MNETEYFFKMLADTTRLRCLMLMQTEGELCVCELSHALNLSQPKISRHLALLRESGMLVARRSGTWMHYGINPDMAAWTLDILDTTANSICETEPFTADIKMLNNMKNRPETICC
jgi:ArsR family transcriptional regulator